MFGFTTFHAFILFYKYNISTNAAQNVYVTSCSVRSMFESFCHFVQNLTHVALLAIFVYDHLRMSM